MKTWMWILVFGMIPFASVTAQDNEIDRSDEIPIGTFNFGLVLGLNATQIDGDSVVGYHKVGIIGGGEVSYRISEMWMPSVGIFYSQKGSFDVWKYRTSDSRYQLDYVEIPVMLNFIDGGIRISGGLSYGRLINLNILVRDTDETNDRAPYYRDSDINVQLGFGYFIDEHWGFDFRWSRSLFSIVNLDVGNIINQVQVNKGLTFRSIYLF